jgi:hypothetical protein
MEDHRVLLEVSVNIYSVNNEKDLGIGDIVFMNSTASFLCEGAHVGTQWELKSAGADSKKMEGRAKQLATKNLSYWGNERVTLSSAAR